MAKFSFTIHRSEGNVSEEGLRCSQGKNFANPIILKVGEGLRRASLVPWNSNCVDGFNEQGQPTTVEEVRKEKETDVKGVKPAAFAMRRRQRTGQPLTMVVRWWSCLM